MRGRLTKGQSEPPAPLDACLCHVAFKRRYRISRIKLANFDHLDHLNHARPCLVALRSNPDCVIADVSILGALCVAQQRLPWMARPRIYRWATFEQ